MIEMGFTWIRLDRRFIEYYTILCECLCVHSQKQQKQQSFVSLCAHIALKMRKDFKILSLISGDSKKKGDYYPNYTAQ